MSENNDKLRKEISALKLKLIEDEGVPYEKEKIKELIKIVEGFVFDLIKEKEVEFEGEDITLEIENLKSSFKVFFKRFRENFLSDDILNDDILNDDMTIMKGGAHDKIYKLYNIIYELISKVEYLKMPERYKFLMYKTNIDFENAFKCFKYLIKKGNKKGK